MSAKISVSRKAEHQQFLELCEAKDIEGVKAMVAGGIDLRQPWVADYYPLSALLREGPLALLEYLLEQGMPPYLNVHSLLREAPDGDLSVFSLLGEWTPQSHDALMLLLHYGSRSNSPETGYNALAGLAGQSEWGWSQGMRVRVSHCVLDERSDAFFSALLSHGPDVDQMMSTGRPLLHQIAEGNNRYVAPLIAMSKKVDIPESKRFRSRTALRCAAREGNDFAVEALLKAGAKPNLTDAHTKETILDETLKWQARDKSSRRHLYGDYPRVISLLRDHGAKTAQELVDGD